MKRVFLLTILVVVALTASANGATRLGPDLTVKPCAGQTACIAAVGCQVAPYSPCSHVNLHSSNAGVPVAAPSSGIITRWRFRAGCCIPDQTQSRTLTLKTFRPGVNDGLGGYSYIVPVKTGPSFVIPSGSQVVSDPPVELPARLPIAAGERVGIVADEPIGIAVYNPSVGVISTDIAANSFYLGEQYGVSQVNQALAIGVDIEADADGDGFGDESQDCAPNDPATQGTCPTTPHVDLSPVYKPGPCEGPCGGGGVPGFSGPIAFAPNTSGVVYVPLKCPANAVQPCGGFLDVTKQEAKKASTSAKRKRLAHVRYSIEPGKTKKLRVKLSKAGRRLLKQNGKLKVVLTVRPDEGDAKSVRRTLKWRGAPR